MASRRSRWQFIGACTIAAVVGAAAFSSAQFTSFSDRSQAALEGNWQSCREGDGQYSERVYDGRWPGVGPFELHLGPYHEFALFIGVQEEHRDHNSPANLLKPHTVELRANKGAHKWEAGGLRFEAALAGGSREECESWFVRLLPATTSSH